MALLYKTGLQFIPVVMMIHILMINSTVFSKTLHVENVPKSSV